MSDSSRLKGRSGLAVAGAGLAVQNHFKSQDTKGQQHQR